MRKLLLEALEIESALNLHTNVWLIMTTSSASQQLINMHAVPVDNGSFDAILAIIRTPRRTEQCTLSALQEETRDPDVVVENVLHVQDGHHQIPGPTRTTSENGDPINEELLHADHRAIEAVRLLLGLAILDNAITVKHYWLIVTSLREKLLQAGPHEIPHGDAYARVLLRLVERLVSYSNFQQNSGYVEEYGLCSCRRDYAQCLGKFLTEMAEGFVFMQQTGIEDDVYIRNKEPHADYLCYLASRLGGVPTI
ncbi:hypothetical protein KC19_4G259100 [Ceratodon purpureus]|uniref:Uncharacterized protein n=1 Tax=Ceratodon purpureus TaxID=3225 RepID=A0A8T0IDQ3_CERPU|nr:hypothetical protein KC19_4G259100 [Ceratodon purpureus]